VSEFTSSGEDEAVLLELLPPSSAELDDSPELPASFSPLASGDGLAALLAAGAAGWVSPGNGNFCAADGAAPLLGCDDDPASGCAALGLLASGEPPGSPGNGNRFDAGVSAGAAGAQLVVPVTVLPLPSLTV
jgi:hypothetical protein